MIRPWLGSKIATLSVLPIQSGGILALMNKAKKGASCPEA